MGDDIEDADDDYDGTDWLDQGRAEVERLMESVAYFAHQCTAKSRLRAHNLAPAHEMLLHNGQLSHMPVRLQSRLNSADTDGSDRGPSGR